MANLYHLNNITKHNEDTLKVLVRGIKNSKENFSLILIRCNYASLRTRMVKQWQEIYKSELASSVKVQELVLPKSSTTLYTTIHENIAGDKPQALMIFGLHSVNDVDKVLISANNVRENFRYNFPFPIVLWITDEILRKLHRAAPDLYSWAADIHELIITTEELLILLQQAANDILAIGVKIDVGQRVEIELALKELQNRNYSLQPKVFATLQSLLEQQDYTKDKNELNLDTESKQFEDEAVDNMCLVRTLVRAITFTQGQFSLILIRCNYTALRDRILESLHELSSVEIRAITLPASAKTLYTDIFVQVGDEKPPLLMIFGLESVRNLDKVLISTNYVRDEFRKNFDFPIILWVNDAVLKKLIRLAPHFESWAITIKFALTTEELIYFIHQATDEIFAIDATQNLEINGELKTALHDLQNLGIVLEPEIAASLEFVLGLYDYMDDQIYSALEHYEQSLQFWRQSNYLERQGILLANIALVYYRKAERNQVDNQEDWQVTKEYLQQSIDIFKQAQRLDLVAKHISKLGEVLRNLKAWGELQSLSQKSLTLHQNYGTPLQVAQDYGFLAEVALEQFRWNDANQLVQQALQVLNDIPNLQPHKGGLYWLILSRSHQGLGEVKAAISNLEIAKYKSNPQYDPQLYISILEKLRLLYFEQGQYLKAFHIKQEQVQIEHQYGFRAFIGASYLKLQAQTINSSGSQVENPETIAQEIAASGRGKDVMRLRERVTRIDQKLIVIYGQSGVGKSSILQGGLIPALQQQSIDGLDALPILLRVYTDWVRILGQCLAENFEKVRGNKLSVNLNSTAAIIEQLMKNIDQKLLTVLIFDQFEEFFFVYTDVSQRQQFYDFLRSCLNIPFLKVFISLREDYLHHLLEFNRLFDLSVINNNILDKNNLYYVGNFSPEDAKAVVQSLTERSRVYLESILIDKLVEDLASNLGEVRPIELQIVGTQLQTDKITTLVQYQQLGTKEKLVQRFLEEVIKDCGFENERTARLVLYLLADQNGTRPLKTRVQLEADLAAETDKLDLVLEILVKSGLVFMLPAMPREQYQLVHDYLVTFIRQQKGAELLAELQKEKTQRILVETKLDRASQKLKKQFIISTVTSLIAGLLAVATTLSSMILPNFQNSNPKGCPPRSTQNGTLCK